MCEKKGKEVVVTGLDHIKQVITNGEIYDEGNTQGLCEHHHAIKSGRDGYFWQLSVG